MMHYDPEVPPSPLRYGGQNGVLSLVSNGGAWGLGCKPQLSTHPSASVGSGTSFDGGGAQIVQGEEYCMDDRDASLSSSYVNMIGTLAKNRHSFKYIQNRSKIFW